MVFNPKFKKRKVSFLHPVRSRKPRKVQYYKNRRLKKILFPSKRLPSIRLNLKTFYTPKHLSNKRGINSLGSKIFKFVRSKKTKVARHVYLNSRLYTTSSRTKLHHVFFSFQRQLISTYTDTPSTSFVMSRFFWHGLGSESLKSSLCDKDSLTELSASGFYSHIPQFAPKVTSHTPDSLICHWSDLSLVGSTARHLQSLTRFQQGSSNTFLNLQYHRPATLNLDFGFHYLKSRMKFISSIRQLITLHKKLKHRKFTFLAVSNLLDDYIDSSNIHRGLYAERRGYSVSPNSRVKKAPQLKFPTQTKGSRGLHSFSSPRIKLRVLTVHFKSLRLRKRPTFRNRYMWKRRRMYRSKLARRGILFFLRRRFRYFRRRLMRRKFRKVKKLRWKKRFILRSTRFRRRVYRTLRGSKKFATRVIKKKVAISPTKVLRSGSRQLKKQIGRVSSSVIKTLKLRYRPVVRPGRLLDFNRGFVTNPKSAFVGPRNALTSSFIDLTSSSAHQAITSRGNAAMLFTKPMIVRLMILQPLLESSLKSVRCFSPLTNPRYFLTAWASKVQNNLETSLFGPHASSTRLSNIWSPSRIDITVRKRLAKASASSLFKPRLANWYYVTLVRFLENSLGRKVALIFGPFVDEVLSFEERSHCILWAGRLKGFQRMLGKRIFLIESTRIILSSFKLKDPILLSNWILAMLKRMSFWKYRLIFRYLDFLVRHVLKLYFPNIGVKGFKIQLKGKISVAGNARTRTLFKRVGNTSHAKMDNRVAYHLSLVNTFTGVMGLKVWIFY